MTLPIPLSSPDITAVERDAVMRVLDSPQLSLGPMLPAFEEAVARAVGSPYAVAVNSGTSGLHLCVKAAGLGDGDEVITSPFSFVASANCLLYENAIPRFVDIDPVTLNLDPDRISPAINARTRAILPIHVFGRPCDLDSLVYLSSRFGLTIIEDSCEAIGARYHGRCCGTFGQTGVFAFYPNKQITTGEGGVIATASESIARLCRSWRNQGRSGSAAWLLHERLGYNYRLSDIQCALGCAQVSRLDSILAKREAAATAYSQLLADKIPELILPAPPEPDTSISWFVYVVRLHESYSAAQRDQVIDQLRSRGIGCSNYFSPIHLQPYFVERFGYRHGDFPITESISSRTIALPFFTSITTAQIETVVAALREALSSLNASHSFSASPTCTGSSFS